MRHVSVIWGHPISIGFHGLTSCQWDPSEIGASHTDNPMERNDRYCRRLAIVGDLRSTSRTMIIFGAILVGVTFVNTTIGGDFGSGSITATLQQWPGSSQRHCR